MEKEVPFAEVVEELRVLTMEEILAEVNRLERERDEADQPYVDKQYKIMVKYYNKGVVDAVRNKFDGIRFIITIDPNATRDLVDIKRTMGKALTKFKKAIAVNKHTVGMEFKDKIFTVLVYFPKST
jgi:hypothetical protein